jgi:hypothetical protein
MNDKKPVCDHCGKEFDVGELSLFDGENLCSECEAWAIEYIFNDRGDPENEQ